MVVRLTAEEQSADFLVRKAKRDYRIYPISDAALRWLKGHVPHARWGRMNGQEMILTTSRAEVVHLVSDMHHDDFRVGGGFPS